MKRICLLLIVFIPIILLAQAPQGMKYQAVVRDASGDPLAERLISLRFSVLQGSDTGDLLYQEIHDVTSNAFGLVNVVIGEGDSPNEFTAIPWGNGESKWLKVEMDSTGGSDYELMGASQLLSVPYAFYAENGAGGTGETVWMTAFNGIYYDDGPVAIGADAAHPTAALDVSSTEKGFLPPRMSEAQRDQIENPATGLMVFNTTTNCINVFHSNTWYALCGECLPPPVAGLSSNSPVCLDGDIQLNGPDIADATYQWTGPDGFSSTEQDPVISNASYDNEGDYQLIMSNACGESDPATTTVEIIEAPGAAGSITGNTEVCEGDDNVTYSLDPVADAEEYQWSIPSGASIESGEGTSSISLDFSGASTGQLQVTPLNDCGSGTASQPLDVTVIPQPVADAGDDQLDVSGTSVTLDANTPAGGSGEWSILSGSGGNIVSPEAPNSEFTGEAGGTYELEWTVTNTCGTASDQVNISFAMNFVCGDSLLDTRDMQKYATVEIGGICWFAENINIGTQLTVPTDQTDNAIIEKYCYDNDPANCVTYGGLYQWSEMMQLPDNCETQNCDGLHGEDHQGICPEGWHVPTDEEYKQLEVALGMSQADADLANTWRGAPVGADMKLGGSSGFDALLSGRVSGYGSFSLMGSYGYPYTASEYGEGNAWRRCLRTSPTPDAVGRWNTFGKDYAFSVRCVKND